MLDLGRGAIDTSSPVHDAVPASEDRSDRDLDRVVAVEIFDRDAYPAALGLPVGVGSDGVGRPADRRGAIRDHSADGVRYGAGGLAGDHAAEAPPDQGGLLTGLVEQCRHPFGKDRGVTFRVTSVDAQPPAGGVVAEPAQIRTQRGHAGLWRLPAGNVDHLTAAAARHASQLRRAGNGSHDLQRKPPLPKESCSHRRRGRGRGRRRTLVDRGFRA